MTGGRRSLHGLLVVRLLLVSNGLILAVVGVLYAAFGTRPGGYIVGAILVVAAVGLWALIPLTDPYRSERRL